MAKVWCAAIECKHNKGNQCRAKEINLSNGHIHTVHEGCKRVWGCRTFAESDEFKILYNSFNELMRGEKHERD